MNRLVLIAMIVPACLTLLFPGCTSRQEDSAEPPGNSLAIVPAPLVQFGAMREVIGLGKDQARVRLEELTRRPNFYGVGAVEGLSGEATIINSEVTITKVDDQHQLQSVEGDSELPGATLVVGGYINHWHEVTIEDRVPSNQLDDWLASQANAAGLSPDARFVFVVEGSLNDTTLHVINGACPVHAKRNNQLIPADRQPFVMNSELISGTLVGVYAAGAAGKLTHPGTSSHRHLVFQADNDARLTGHIEANGIEPGSLLRIGLADE